MKQSGRSSLEDLLPAENADATLTAASETELRRRATEGDSAAYAELTRRQVSRIIPDTVERYLGSTA